jgi:hypothetical protein
MRSDTHSERQKKIDKSGHCERVSRSPEGNEGEAIPKAFGTPRNDGSTDFDEVYFHLSFTIMQHQEGACNV